PATAPGGNVCLGRLGHPSPLLLRSPSRPNSDAHRASLAHRLRRRFCRCLRPELALRTQPRPPSARLLPAGPSAAVVVQAGSAFATTHLQTGPLRPPTPKAVETY